ncbi:MAG: MerC domain-containing protein [Pseudomonadota bacterium]
MNGPSPKSQPADALAVGVSSLCLIHCMVLPAIVSLSPLLGLASEEWVHRALVVAAAPISLFVLFKADRGMNRHLLAGCVIIGLLFLFAGAFVEALHDYEQILTVAGALTLGTVHATRWWRHRTRTLID